MKELHSNKSSLFKVLFASVSVIVFIIIALRSYLVPFNHAKTHHQKIDFNIYEGMEVTGNAAKTFVRGHLAWDGTNLHTVEGFGRYVDRPCFARFYESQKTRNAQSQPKPVERVLPTRS